MNDIIDLTEESVNFVLDSPKKQETKPLNHRNIYVSTLSNVSNLIVSTLDGSLPLAYAIVGSNANI